MNVYLDLAHDAGYQGEEAEQVAQMLERQAYEDYMRWLEEQQLDEQEAESAIVGEET